MNNNISAQPKRLMAVDILRGMTVMLMIMVNNGAGKEIFVTLQHSKWNGMTPCDLVFPFFLFIMGFSIFLSLKKSNFTWSAAIAKKIAKRTILLFAIGLLINWLGMASSGKATDIEHLRIWGSDATIGSVLLRCFDNGNSNSAANVQDDCFCAIGNIRSDFSCWQRICRRFSYKLLGKSRQLAIW